MVCLWALVVFAVIVIVGCCVEFRSKRCTGRLQFSPGVQGAKKFLMRRTGRDDMGLDVWFREDVTRILASVWETQRRGAAAVTPLDVEYAAAYQRGFVDAIRAVAVGFGIAPPARVGPRSETLDMTRHG